MLLAIPLLAAVITAPEHLLTSPTSASTGLSDLDPESPLDLGRAEPDLAAAAKAAIAVQGFTADLYRDLAQLADSPDNLVCSPYSVATALAMARAGARGTTAAEIDAVLHAPGPTPTALDSGLNSLDQLMVSRYRDHDDDGTNRPRLAVANSLWPQQDLPIEDTFLATLAAYYGATTHPTDYLHGLETARQKINAWVSDQTAERIPELLAPGALTSDTLFVLVNALYLRASWLLPFDEDLTRPATFYQDDGQATSVAMMAAAPDYLAFSETADWLAVRLPYVGSQLAMTVVMPRSGPLSTIESTLDGSQLAQILGGLGTARIRLRLPRWETRVPAALRDSLVRLGMPSAFRTDADLTGLSPIKPLCIDAVVHETFITVNEKGTEAAAATAIIAPGGTGQLPPTPRNVTVDRPFLYVIHDSSQAVPLFIGRVTAPEPA